MSSGGVLTLAFDQSSRVFYWKFVWCEFQWNSHLWTC